MPAKKIMVSIRGVNAILRFREAHRGRPERGGFGTRRTTRPLRYGDAGRAQLPPPSPFDPDAGAPHALPGAVGPYPVIAHVGAGASGDVFRAVHPHTGRAIVVKQFRSRCPRSPHAEVEALTRLDHPNVVQVLDCGQDGGRFFIAMELVADARPISAFCRHNRLTLAERVALMAQVCEAVSYAHRCGLVHGDVKPGNVLVRVRGGHAEPKLVDFGVAALAGAGAAPGGLPVGTPMGTPEYMAPERGDVDAGCHDEHGDVYSLGVILYELLTDTLPIEGLREMPRDWMLARLRDDFPPPPSERVLAAAGAAGPALASIELAAVLNGALDDLVMKSLAKDPLARPQSAAELGSSLRTFLQCHEMGQRRR
jgi:eukaryotic-like serine/threonine-protein kinase